MKKYISSLIVFLLVLSTLIPIKSANAHENNGTNDSLQSNLSNESLEDVEFETIENNDSVGIIEVTYDDGSTSISEYNKESGEVFFDGELVATLTEENAIEENNSGTITPFASYKTYNIGDSSNGSGVYAYKYSKTFSLTVSSAATVVAIAATLAQAFLEKKPNQKAAALVSAAAGLIALATTGYTFKIKYTHTKDSKKSYRYMDWLMIYKGV
ncbi:hypothetical protein BK139_23120 [Paenibacillus sp. FSL R5-0490]|uniref:hypothetical protein n=1 Tax=Paenibacillus sp. FSL R5-0490 TaxID=1920424 RepID=UPI00096E3D45|nr:hypothetical protein [Paenibacillus sp. FSL R5-0490]OMF51748.1 hypothetical protein BK139_23120 [Paenibacillus sp. FSL R5-0490]